MDEKKQTRYELKTGEHIILKSVLPTENIEKLKEVANRLQDSKSRPIYIANEKLLGEHTKKRYESAGMNFILKHAKPWIRRMIGEQILILTNKALIRRTWPLSEAEARNLGHNASNLTWHQDSNHKHGDKPMIVMMISLQDGAGVTRPGLSILQCPTNQFEGVFGYEGNRVDEFEKKITEQQGELRVTNPTLNSGDLLLFNGLTFHRTFSNQFMNDHRDALLVRIVRPEHAKNFIKTPHLIVKTR
tara:strand:+ start:1015 stop:1749 length:735 start_codon:yes stop_codon:yes gene_type:complete